MVARPTALEPEALEVRVTAMRRRHLRQVLRIENQVYPRPWSLGLFMSELALRTGRIYLIARVGPRLVGYAGLLFSVDDGHITTVAVDPEWQHRKVGTRLLLHLCRQAVVKGARNLTLEVRMTNEDAQQLYRRFGFVPAGVRKGYYVETKEDAMVMWAHDVDLPAYSDSLDEIERAIPGSTIIEFLE